MATDIYIYFPTGKEGAGRGELQDDIEDFFGNAAEDVGAGSGIKGSNLDYELADGEDVEQWVTRLREFLRERGAKPGTWISVYPDGWQPGDPHRRVEVFGKDEWVTGPA